MQPTTNRQVHGQQQISSSLRRSTSSYHWRLLSLILRYFSNSMLPFATVHLWPQPVTARRMLSDESLNKPGRSFCSPFSKDNSGLPETSYQTCSLSHDYLSNGLRQAYQKRPFWKQETKTWFTLQNVCVCTQRERDWNGFWLQGVKMMRWDLNWWQLILLSPSVNLMCSQHTYYLNYLLGAMSVLGIANIKGQLKCLSPFESSLQWKIHMDTKKKSRLHLEYCQGITKKMGHFAWKEKPGLHRRLN